ncbi:peptide-methionine (R)-S-oxide reductase MsrB [Methanohalophilus levihalophilus]|uniref:peptide-methionine (R)-S-oxide reductase MsrB n=1 Tax=Methanohalophilus levihalophilus TaxID=1431282 RepID=UPI001AEAC7CB
MKKSETSENWKRVSDAEWKKRLKPEEYHILRQKGTEAPFSGEYDNHYKAGIYKCAACGQDLFSSKTKYDAGTGWPSFWSAISEDNIERVPDYSLMMKRTEVTCSRCGSHLGHVFDDGPPPTGEHFCIDSLALKFVPDDG